MFADSGSYRAFGVDVTEDALEDQQYAEAFRSRRGIVLQNTDAQLFSPTVRDEMAFGPLNMGLATGEAASALVMNPSALLFDEPTAALDPATQVWFLDLLDELADAGKTLVVATHDQATVERLTDHQIIIDEAHRITPA